MLSLQLRALEEDGLISRTQYEEITLRVEYRLTRAGLTLLPILDALCDWAILYYLEQISADFIKRTPGRSACGTDCASGATDSS